MALDMGAGAGGAQMLQDVLTRKRLEQQALREAQNMVAQRELQARGQDVQIAGQDAAQRRFDQIQQQKAEEAAAKREAAHAQAVLTAGIQGSYNAGAGDPNGAKATRDALRVALTAGGADARDIPQEPVAQKPKLYAVTVPGPHGKPVHKLVTEDQMQQGVEEYRAPERAEKPNAPQIFYDADGKAHAVQYGPSGMTEVPMPAGLVGRTPPKPAAKTPDVIEAEAAARARGTAKGKGEGKGSGRILSAIANVFGGGDEATAPATAPQDGAILARDPNGKLHKAKAGTPLPAGWKLEG